jgi:hypothetical protein
MVAGAVSGSGTAGAALATGAATATTIAAASSVSPVFLGFHIPINTSL